MDGDWIQAGVLLGFVVIVLWRGSRAVDDRTLRRWEQRFGIGLPGELREEAAARLRRDRTLRTSAIAAGVSAGASPAFMNLIEPERSGDFANPATSQAWLLAAALGALVAVGRRPAGPRRASVVRRRIGDYVELRWVWATGVSAALSLMAASAGARSDAINAGWWWVYAAGGLLAVVASAHGLRAVRDRAIPTPDGPGRDLDDSLRADRAHHLVGASLALAAASAAGGLWLVFYDSAPIVALAGQVVSLMALGCWWTLARNARWSVRARRVPAAA